MTVYVVVSLKDAGMVAGVFSTLDKASEYINGQPYTAYSIHERVVDKAE